MQNTPEKSSRFWGFLGGYALCKLPNVHSTDQKHWFDKKRQRVSALLGVHIMHDTGDSMYLQLREKNGVTLFTLVHRLTSARHSLKASES